MTDYSELKRLAEACDVSKCADETEYGRCLAEFYSECEPEEVLALIAENERLMGFVVHRRAQADQYDEALIRIADRRDQLKAENARSTEREILQLAEIEALRKYEPCKDIVWCGCGDGYPANTYGAGFMDGSGGRCEHCVAAMSEESQS